MIAFALIGLILWVTNSFVGNPISRALATHAINKYLETNYAELNLEVKPAVYNFKIGKYNAWAKSKESVDTHFTVYCTMGGKVTADDFEDRIPSGWNTYTRIEKEYREFVTPIIESNLPYDFYIVLADLERLEKPAAKLPLDMNLDVYNVPLAAYVTVYLYTDDVSWDNVAGTALELDGLMQENSLAVDQYTVVLKPGSPEEEKKGESLGIYDFPQELLGSDDLPKFMEEYFYQWENGMNNVKKSK